MTSAQLTTIREVISTYGVSHVLNAVSVINQELTDERAAKIRDLVQFSDLAIGDQFRLAYFTNAPQVCTKVSNWRYTFESAPGEITSENIGLSYTPVHRLPAR